MAKLKETDLYPPVKALLEAQGYEVKSEIGACDVMAVRGDEPPVIVELKTGFTLSLFHQAIDRLAISDAVYVAAPRGKGRAFLSALKSNMKLCRRLGLGLISVRMEDGFCEIHLDPGPYAPRKSRPKSDRLLREFARRIGDPNQGGSTRTTIVTAYRQDAMRIAVFLLAAGPAKASEVAKATGVARARPIMADDHYGWFERVDRGIYQLTPKGREAVASDAVPQ
ncbi:DUF2161 family putative PD-(D/E)XK-type phosphodiesterase [Oricola sp.]|uniref:DUF2161 domain-containing phosphodiesterase n=1 Tax=Oricola sp. TaxID=1979950 RepID=UPI0025DCA9AC|nr:DUF2161 family putative PD-(D/E)XK-type phosphodiesterase [Oricola sp.]MCI5073682.1 DUF2161 family putative PD-(D/E)XK-type phosphodiesterase [Oricola sp.]